MAYSKNTKPIKIAVGKTTALNYIKSFSANAKTPEEKKEIENLVRLVDAFEKDIARLLQDSNFEYKKILLDDLYTLLKNLKVLTENNINAISDLAKSNIKSVLGKISGNSEAARDLGDILDYANTNLPVLLKHLYEHLDKHFTEVDKVISGLTDSGIFQKPSEVKSDINNLFNGIFETFKIDIIASVNVFGKNILNSINAINPASSNSSYKSIFSQAKKTSNKLIKVLDKLEDLSKGVLENRRSSKDNLSDVGISGGINSALTNSIELKKVNKELDKLNAEHKNVKAHINKVKKSGGIFTFLASTLFTPPGMFFAGFLYGYFEENILYLFNEYLNPLLDDIISGKASDKIVKKYHSIGEYWLTSLDRIDYAIYTISNMFEIVLKSFDWVADAAIRVFPYLQSILSIFLDPESLRKLWNTVEGHVLAQQYINMTTRAFNVAAKRIASLAIVGGGGSNFGFFGISGFSEILRSIPGLALSGVNWWLAYSSVKSMFDEAIPESLDEFDEVIKLDQEKYKNEVNALLDKYSPYKAYSSEQEYKPNTHPNTTQVGRLGTIQIQQNAAGESIAISDLRVGSDLAKTFVQSSVYDTDVLRLARENGLSESEAKSIAKLNFNPIISGTRGNPLLEFDKMFGTATLQAAKDLSIDGQTNQLMSMGTWINLDDGLSHKELIDSISAKGLTDMNTILDQLIRSYSGDIKFGNDESHLKNLSHHELITKIYNASLDKNTGILDKSKLDANISKFIINNTNVPDTQTMRDMFKAYFNAVDRTHINYEEMLKSKNAIDDSGNINIKSALEYGSATLATTRSGISQSIDVFNIQALAKAAERYSAVYDDLMKSGNIEGANQARQNMMFLKSVIRDLSNSVLASNSVISEGLKTYIPEVAKQLNDILAKRIVEHRELIKESIDSYIKDREERTSQSYIAPVAEQDIMLIHKQFNETAENLSY